MIRRKKRKTVLDSTRSMVVWTVGIASSIDLVLLGCFLLRDGAREDVPYVFGCVGLGVAVMGTVLMVKGRAEDDPSRYEDIAYWDRLYTFHEKPVHFGPWAIEWGQVISLAGLLAAIPGLIAFLAR